MYLRRCSHRQLYFHISVPITSASEWLPSCILFLSIHKHSMHSYLGLYFQLHCLSFFSLAELADCQNGLLGVALKRLESFNP